MLFDGCKYMPFILKVFHFAQIFFKNIRILPQNTTFKQVNIAKERMFSFFKLTVYKHHYLYESSDDQEKGQL